MKTIAAFVFLSLFLLFGSIQGQYDAAYYSLAFLRSIPAASMGEQGVASGNPLDAMQYNPANLGFTTGTTLAFFNRPWKIWDMSMPFSAVSVLTTINEKQKIGIEFTYWNEGDVISTDVYGNESGKEKSYESSIAGEYSYAISKQFIIGAQLRYVWLNFPQTNADNLLFSTGLLYIPELFDNKLNIGFSLMNFGTTQKIETELKIYTIEDQNRGIQYYRSSTRYSLPSIMNLGVSSYIVKNNFYKLNLSLGVTKPLVKHDDYNGEAKSSFNALFTDWKDFPRDVTGQIGFGYEWEPLNLGNGFSYIQNMYLGYFSTGPAEYLSSFFTHGFNVGVKYSGIQATVGYTGEWHNIFNDRYITFNFPRESFQFTVSSDCNFFSSTSKETVLQNNLKGIILSAGYNHGFAVGRMKNESYYDTKISTSLNSVFSLGADFYINESMAIISQFNYGRAKIKYESSYWYITPDYIEEEMFSLSSGIRYHLLESYHPFFIQGSLGIIRINPIIKTSPRYYYQTFTDLRTGCAFEIDNSGLVVIPSVGLKTIFMRTIPNFNRLGGYNQFELGLNVGYKF